MKSILHRDQIHGDVHFDPMAGMLLNTATLQRLGRIYQLGYAHLVYRGGTHSRLSHVMGASHVAGLLVDLLRTNYSEVRKLPLGAADQATFLPGEHDDPLEARWDVLKHLVRWAALLHDVSHVPLGHTLEDEFSGIYAKHDDFRSPRIPYLWGYESDISKILRQEDLLPPSFEKLQIRGEQVWRSVMLICLHKEKADNGRRLTFLETIANEDATAVPFIATVRAAIEAVANRFFFPYMADIVGNTICADYFDYLRRDPSNVGLDVLRDYRVASRFYIGMDANDQFRMALSLVDRQGKPRLDTCTGVVELVRQRFRFAEIIYYHKTKVAASAMFAKVLALIGKPEEVGRECEVIKIENIDNLATKLSDKTGGVSVKKLREACLPSVLLDPEIGDETLLLSLQLRAFEVLEQAVKQHESLAAKKALRAISLLQGIVRRQLYKVCLTIDCRTHAELAGGSQEPSEIERKIQGTLQRFRTAEDSHQRRDQLEMKMANAAGLPDGSFLLYVPPRKNQAKGIETYALDHGELVTLGNHSAVQDDVARLNEKYRDLWRIILLVHPNYRDDAIALSKAIDELILEIWPGAELHDEATIKTLRDASWCHYIPGQQRPAAVIYGDLISPSAPSWEYFTEAARATVDGTVSTEEHAFRAFLLSIGSTKHTGPTELIRRRYGSPDSLSNQVKTLMESFVAVEGREGKAENQRAALRRIAEELFP